MRFYVVEDISGFAGPVPFGYTLTDASTVTVDEASEIIIDGARVSSLTVRDAAFNTATHNVSISFADSSSGAVNSARLTLGEDIRPTVTVAAGQDVSQWTIAAGGSGGLTLTAGTDSKLGQIAGAEDASVQDRITLGDGATVTATGATGPGASGPEGAIDVNAGADVIQLGANVTVEGALVLEGSGDTLTAGDGLRITRDGEGSGGGIDGALGGGKTITLGSDAQIDGEIRGSSADDSVTLGDRVTITGDITLGDGANDLTAGDDLRLSALTGGNGIDVIDLGDRFVLGDQVKLYGDDDRITLGDDASSATGTMAAIDGGDGDDTFTVGRINIDAALRLDGGAGPNSITFTKGAIDGTGAPRTSDLLTALVQEATGDGRVNGINDGGASSAISDGQLIIDDFDAFCVICFSQNTRILTPYGEVPVDRLAPGDTVWTRDNGVQPLRWIGRRTLSAAELRDNPTLHPIRIAAGALAPGVPTRDLVVSPQHRVLIRSRIAERMFGQSEVLVATKQLLSLPGVSWANDMPGVTYIHLLTPQHDIVMADGAEAETLYPGPEALRTLTPDARAEVMALFPEAHSLSPARVLVPGRRGRKLAERHIKNGQRLLA